MGFKDLVFRLYNNYLKNVSRIKYSQITPGRNNELFQKFYTRHMELENSLKYADNIEKIYYSKLSPSDQEKFKLVKAYREGFFSGSPVDATEILEKIDKEQVLKNIKLVEENEKDYDPEMVQLEKLKGAMLLEEPGAEQKLLEYVKERPYLKKYLKWADLQESTRYQYLG